MKCVCSWDIGIKHLSYCLIEKAEVNNKSSNYPLITLGDHSYHIKLWDVINLMPSIQQKKIQQGEITLENRPNVTCCYQMKTLKLKSQKESLQMTTCHKKAMFCCPTIKTPSDCESNSKPDQETYYYGLCNKHFQDFQKKNEELPFEPDKKKWIYLPNGQQCQGKGQGQEKKCNGKITYIDKQQYYLGYCSKHIQQDKVDNYLKIIKNKKAIETNLTLIGDVLFDTLHKLVECVDYPDIILLENQPVLKNPTMKSIQMFLYSYFILYGLQNTNSPIEDIKCYSANQKCEFIKYITRDEDNQLFIDLLSKTKNKYQRNKKCSIQLVKHLLEHHGKYCDDIIEFFNNHSKKDDLADSLLMGLHYLERDVLKKMPDNKSIKQLLNQKNKNNKK